VLYDNFVRRITDNFHAAISEIEAEYNFDYGSEFEVALCKTLRRVLPQKFGICRGFVIDQTGETAGDDIIIYERLRFPTLRSLEDDYTRKEKVPIEAVFAYIEAKHTLQIKGEGPGSLLKAISQTAKVKELCNKRKPVPLTQINPSLNAANLNVTAPEGFPPIRNPMYTMILARRVCLLESSGVTNDSQAIAEAMLTCGITATVKPDLIVAGESNVMYPGIWRNEKTVLLSPFLFGDGVQLVGRITNGLSLGVALVHLLWALDLIELGKMSWSNILSEGLGYTNITSLSDSLD